LLHGKQIRYPLYRRLGGSQGRSRQVGKFSRPPGSDPRTFQPVASCYICKAISVHNILNIQIISAISKDGRKGQHLQEMLNYKCNISGLHRVHNSQLVVFTLSQINPDQGTQSYVLQFYFSVILQFKCRSFKLSLSFRYPHQIPTHLHQNVFFSIPFPNLILIYILISRWKAHIKQKAKL
jgi:hypothetical protein